MNILFLPKLLPRKDVIGGPILIHHRIKNLSKLGHKIFLIAPAYEEKDKKDQSLSPFCEKILLVDSQRIRTKEEIDKLYQKHKRARFFLKGDGGYSEEIEKNLNLWLDKYKIDVVVAEYAVMGQYFLDNPGIPEHTLTVISVHECYTRAAKIRMEKGENLKGLDLEELESYEFAMYDNADLLLSLTKEDRDILVSYKSSLEKKIRVVPHGVDTEFYHPPEKRDPQSKRILYLGNYQHHPNMDAVQNFMKFCWEKVQKEVPEAEFWAVGFNPPPEITKYRSEKVIVQQGGEDVRKFYWSSDVFVAPIELGGGFRGKLLEAMSTGLPVVSTTLGVAGINPVIGEEILVADNYDEFAELTIKLLKDQKFRNKIGKNALTLAQRFDHKMAAKKLDGVLEDSLKEKSRHT
ncbi:MAG: glycosyltransferase family 4 protein [Candidatus Zixiibacteriota bacterium]